MEQSLLPALKDAIVELVTEAYQGPRNPPATWMIDNEPNASILPILDSLSAEEASRSVDGSGQRGTSIAANAEHLRWSLANVNGAIRGEPYRSNWGESWELIGADEQKWQELRSALRAEFETLIAGIQSATDLRDEFLTGTLALIGHAAYHLGSIRQMVERVRAAKQPPRD